MCFKVTLVGSKGGIRHLNNCTREVAGDAARAFAVDAPTGAVLTIAKVETIRHAEVTGEDGKVVERAYVEKIETIAARATREANPLMGMTAFWRADKAYPPIAGVTCSMPEKARLDADGTSEPRTRLVATNVDPGVCQIVKADAIQDTRTGEKTPLLVGAPLLSSLL